MGSDRPPYLTWVALLEALPFSLQVLGLGLGGGIGEGLCGSALLSEAEAVRYGLVSGYVLYARLFLLLLALKLAYALGLALLSFMGWVRLSRGLWRVGVALSALPLLGFLLTRTLPLPFLTPLGPALLPPAPLDPLALLMLLPELPLLGLLLRLRPVLD